MTWGKYYISIELLLCLCILCGGRYMSTTHVIVLWK